MSGAGPVIVRLRRELRLSDHPALAAAAERGVPVVPLFVWSPEEAGDFPPGAASRAWLSRSLVALDASLRAVGSRLVLRRGDPLEAIRSVARSCRAKALFRSSSHEPGLRARDDSVDRELRRDGLEVVRFGGSLLHDPGAVRSSSGTPFRVFTPFWRCCRSLPEPSRPLPSPAILPPPATWPASVPLEGLRLAPPSGPDGGILETWEPGERGARRLLNRFLDEGLASYPADRDRPDRPGTSRLSPHLHFGEISLRMVWHAVSGRAAADPSPGTVRGAEAYLRQVGWREFAHHLLVHFPETSREPLRPEFAAFPWRYDREELSAWKEGRTGYPFVDAGMRQLRATGWMHNRVRMVVASFLVKDLLLSWREGAAWFHETLVDADLANNTLGWQWVAGCGADAAPYFRIFNPVSQGMKFDPAGEYVRQWVPELSGLPPEWIHRPWEAPPEVLRAGGVALGRNYPAPRVDHAAARRRALSALEAMRKVAAGTIPGKRRGKRGTKR